MDCCYNNNCAVLAAEKSAAAYSEAPSVQQGYPCTDAIKFWCPYTHVYHDTRYNVTEGSLPVARKGQNCGIVDVHQQQQQQQQQQL